MRTVKPDGTMSFTPEEVADGRLIEFIQVLLKNKVQMKVWTDGYCYVVEYLEDISVADGKAWELLDEDMYIADSGDTADGTDPEEK